MKSIFIAIFLLCTVLYTQAQSPNWQELFQQKKTQIKYLVQQIAALKVYLEYLKKGYDIVQGGLTTIGNIKDGKFLLDKTYLSSLKSVSPVIRNSSKLAASIGLQQRIQFDFRALLEDCQNDEMLTGSEQDYIGTVYTNVLLQGQDAMAELEIIIAVGQSEMQDEERLSRLDRVHEKMLDLYAFSQSFISSTRLLSTQRKKETDDLKMLDQFYQQI